MTHRKDDSSKRLEDLSSEKKPRKPYSPPAFQEDEPIDIFVLSCSKAAEGDGCNPNGLQTT